VLALGGGVLVVRRERKESLVREGKHEEERDGVAGVGFRGSGSLVLGTLSG